MKKGAFNKILFAVILVLIVVTAVSCELKDPNEQSGAKFFINDNDYNKTLKNNATKEDAIDNVDNGITNLREYLNDSEIATTGYYMGVEFNINTNNPETETGGNFRLIIKAHLYTYDYLDDDGNLIYKYYDKKSNTYYDEQNDEGTRVKVSAEEIHNEVIKKSDLVVEWYDGVNNKMLIGLYFDGVNNDSDDPGNILYVNIQGYKRYFENFGDTVLYRQMIRLITSLSVESLLTSGNLQEDAGVGQLRQVFEVVVNENYKVVLNNPITSTLFYNITADAIAKTITDFYQKIFEPFQNKIDPLTKKYLGFKFSVMAEAVVNTVNSDMQFFTELNNEGTSEIMTGAYLTFDGTATSNGKLYDYISDISFTYGAYPPDDMGLDREFYKKFENGKFELQGNLYIPMLNSNYDALIRTDMHRTERGPNATNNVFAEFRDIANGELMIGAYYRYEKSFIDISGLEYLYGAIALDELGFPKVYDESLNLGDALQDLSKMVDDMIISIVDGILSPDKNDKENHLLEYIMDKTESTEKTADDIFSKNTVTLTIDMELIKHALEETGNGTYTTRGIINIIDSVSPYSMDQIATLLGVSSAEVMLDKTYFTVTLNVDTNEITIKMFTDVGVDEGEPSTMIFQLDLIFTKFGEEVKIADINFDNFKPLGQIYTYSATMDGNFMFSTAQTVDLSNLLGATIGDNSGLNTVYHLAPESGVTFTLTYDQYVLDTTDADGNIVHKKGRSSFDLRMWVTGLDTEVLISLASDDVAFNNEVYDALPEKEDELGYVWVNIQCCYEKDGKTQRIPPVKIREDVFMSSMQAYMNGTSIADDATKLGESDLNLSITTILFALMEDSYVVAQPEKIEITTSNETVQNLFRVKSLIGNIKADAGFTERVKGLENIKSTYLMYNVGSFTDLEFYSPYSEEAILHSEIEVSFYDDYMNSFDPLKYEFRKTLDGRLQVYYEGKYYDPDDGGYYYENKYRIETQEVDGEEEEVKIPLRIKVDSGITYISRDIIEYSSDTTFFKTQGAENQDITKVRFLYNDALRKIISVEDGVYFYYSYKLDENGKRTRVDIPDQYIKFEGDNREKVYIYWTALREIIFYESGSQYYFYNENMAVYGENDDLTYIDGKSSRKFLFEYEKKSIEITNEGKTQYAPRTNGSLMGEVRRYYLLITSPNQVERSLVTGLNNNTYYSDEDKNNLVEYFDEDGIKIGEEVIPIPLYVMEPAENLPETTETIVAVGNAEEIYSHTAQWNISWENEERDKRLKGDMVVTNVVIAPNTMGADSFPIRIIVSNREIIPGSDGDSYVDLYINENKAVITENVPVVNNATVDPYDYMVAKYKWFSDPVNFNPTQYSDSDFDNAFRQAEKKFTNLFFSSYIFDIIFDADNSRLRELNVKEQYIMTSYTNQKTDGTTEIFDWSFDNYDGSNNTEIKIQPSGGAVYLHTYFRGQLIALRIKVLQREFVRVKFSQFDDYEPAEENGLTINGHYVANYYDEESYVVPTTPILIFRDEENRLYEKVFDFDYIKGVDNNGNYIYDTYGINWENKEIINVGSSGSYYNPEDDDPDMGMINRPFYELIIDDEGNETIIPGENNTDIDTADINLRYVLSIFRKDSTGDIKRIQMIKGDENDDWFENIVLHVRVECPKQEVDDIKVEEIDQHNNDNDGVIDDNEKFVPTAMQYENLPVGYYQIDPLNSETKIIPTAWVLYFKDSNGNRVASHIFNNIQWKNVNEADKVVEYNEVTEKFEFVLSTDEPLTTRIIAKVGSESSGYLDLVLCIKVLSKDPRNIEFYCGESTDEKYHMNDIEKIAVDYGDLAYESTGDNVNIAEDCKYVSYTYYVDTFEGFKLPNRLLATFGTSAVQRTAEYQVSWTSVTGENAVFAPNSLITLQTVIGDDDVKITIYLTVASANYSINRIDVLSELQNYYVKVGTNENYEYVVLGDIYQRDLLSDKKLGFYYKDAGNEKYIVVSAGSEFDGTDDNKVDAGKIGLYRDNNGQKMLAMQMYPYQFIEELYSSIDIIFNQSEAIDRWNIIDFDYENTYVYLHDNSINRQNVKLSDLNNIEFTYDNANERDKLNFRLSIDIDGIMHYLNVEENDKVRIYPSSNMKEEESRLISLQELTNHMIMMEFAKEIKDKEIENIKAATESGSVSYTYDAGTTLSNIYTRKDDAFTFYDNDGDIITFDSIKLKGFDEMSYKELVYRLKYINNYCVTGVTPARISGKEVEITNYDGLFAVNDIVRNITGAAFVPSSKYKIALGQNTGSYDLTLQLIFSGGLRNENSSEEIVVYAYNSNGYAQYGDYGYMLGQEIIASFNATKQDSTLASVKYLYGGGNEKLNDWYVESSDFEDVMAGTVITRIPQSIVYGNKDGNIILSARTSEGFRITRSFSFKGVSSGISTYNSINAELAIDNGLIYIKDIYNYYPLENYFANGNSLPSTIEIETETQKIRISGVYWQILESWSDGKYGSMHDMTFDGTFNEDTGENGNTLIAQANVLGWESVDEKGNNIKNDVVNLKLRVSIDSAKTIELPWNDANPRLETTRLMSDGKEIFAVDVDAFNDANSSAISGSNFVVPTKINVRYTNNLLHTFNNVQFTYNNTIVEKIPYNINGIDVEKLAQQLNLPVDRFMKDGKINYAYIDLKVDLGLGQVLTVRYRFYNKNIENIMAIVAFDDENIRAQILDSQGNLKSEKLEALLEKFNITRIETNVESLINSARLMRERIEIPSANEIIYNVNYTYRIYMWLSLRKYYEGDEFVNGQLQTIFDGEIISESWAEYKLNNANNINLLEYIEELAKDYTFDVDYSGETGNTQKDKENAARAKVLLEYYNCGDIVSKMTLSEFQSRKIDAEYTKNQIKQAKTYLLKKAVFDTIRRNDLGDNDYVYEIAGGEIKVTTNFNTEQSNNFAYDVISVYFGNTDNYTGYINAIAGNGSDTAKISETIANFYGSGFDSCYAEIVKKYMGREAVNFTYEDIFTETADNEDNLNYALYYRNMLEANIDVLEIVKQTFRIMEYASSGIITDDERDSRIFSMIQSEIERAMQETSEQVSINKEITDFINQAIKAQLGIIGTTAEGYTTKDSYSIDNFIKYHLDEDKVAMRKTVSEMLAQALDIFSEDTNDATYGLMKLQTEQAYNDTSSLDNSIIAIKSNIMLGVGATSAIETLLSRAINSYNNSIYMEMNVAKEIRRIQGLVESDSKYVMDPYGDYLYVPSKYVADFNEETGGFSYVFNATWESDNISGKASYKGNQNDDVTTFINLWLDLYETYKSDGEVIEKLDSLLNTKLSSDNYSISWDEIKANNPEEINLSFVEDLASKYTFAISQAIIDLEKGTTEEKTFKAKAKMLYLFYLTAKDIKDASKIYQENEVTFLSIYRMELVDFERLYNENKYSALKTNVYLNTINYGQDIKLLVEVLDKSLEEEELEKIYKPEDENEYYTEYKINNPFVETVDDLPSFINVDGKRMEIIWKNVTISPSGNLEVEDKIIYGNIKNANGQSVQLKLTVNSWVYTGINKEIGEGQFSRMDSGGYLNYYFSKYQEYSGDDRYQVVFDVKSINDEGKTVTETKKIIFYPTDSYLLVNSSDDELMNEVRERKNYVMYWDENIKNSVVQNELLGGMETTVYLGNQDGSYSLNKLADSTSSKTVTKARYYYENMSVDKIKLLNPSETEEYYQDVKDYLMAISGETTIIIDPVNYLPETADILLDEANVNVKYVHSEITTRLLWNNVSFNTAIGRLENFVREVYPDTATNEIREKAKNILMNVNISESEKAELISLAMEYLEPNYNRLGEKEQENVRIEACKLLCINQICDYSGSFGYLTGGIGSLTAVLLVRIGQNTEIYVENVHVKAVYSDYSPLGIYYEDETDGTFKQLSSVSETEQPKELYIKIKSEYWDKASNKNSYKAAGAQAPYNTNDNYVYKLLDMFNKSKESDIVIDNERLQRLDNITYQTVGNMLFSETFEINGRVYKSNILQLPIVHS